MEEIWKEIPNYEGYYEASNLGRVRSWINNKGNRRKEPKIIKPNLKHNCYLQVRLCKNGKRKMYMTHRLVYEAFFGKIPEGMQVNHKDENKQNNILSNIDTLMTPKENVNYGTRNERAAKAISKSLTNHKAFSKPVIQKTLQGDVIKIWESTHEIQRQLGFNQGNISACCRGIEHYKSAYGYIWQYTEKATA